MILFHKEHGEKYKLKIIYEVTTDDEDDNQKQQQQNKKQLHGED